jgi:hypothetical protein
MTINTKTDQKEPWVTSSALMEYLSMSKSLLELLIAQGLPYMKINRNRRYKISAVEQWMLERQDKVPNGEKHEKPSKR